MSHAIAAELAPTGTLRAGINTQNFLLVSGRDDAGEPDGVAPGMARAIAERLGVPLRLVPFESAKRLGDAVDDDAWDIGLLAAEPARAQRIGFTAAYCRIEATYLVPGGSPLRRIADVDRPGVRIAVSTGSAYDLWLTANVKHAELVHAPSIAKSRDLFVEQSLDALAGLRTGLLADAQTMPGTRLLDGHFTTVQQAVGTRRENLAGLAFLNAFVEEAKKTGLVADLIARHGVIGLSVAPRQD
jgi:polar amino acid transport system substrate-binding protein